MAVVKTKRLVRWFEWNVKTIIYVAVYDRPVNEAVVVGPKRYFKRYVLVVTNRDMSDDEVERLVGEVLRSELRCHKCRYRGDYVKVDLKNGKPDTVICDECDPFARGPLPCYEGFDIVFAETRGN